MEGYASEVGSREVASLVSDLLPVLIDKAGDNNSRIRCWRRAVFVSRITMLELSSCLC